MGKLVKQNNKGETWLFRDHTFGRDPRCSTVLKGNAVSRFHARISWNGNEWTLRDLGSRNGTYINGRRQANEATKRIKAGDRILFGDTHEEYLFLEDDEPQSLLITYDGQEKEIRIPLSHLLPLPSTEKPLCTIFCSKDDEFHMENENGEIVTIEHGQQITVDGDVFHVILAHQPNETPHTRSSDMLPKTDGIHLDIAVSPDEESAEIVLYTGTEKLILQPRVHFYLLAYLARIRNSQTPKDMEPLSKSNGDEYGWVDCEVVCNDLMINREHLAQQVFRVRQDFKNHNTMIAERIIDRRLRGKMRIGFQAGSFNVSLMR